MTLEEKENRIGVIKAKIAWLDDLDYWTSEEIALFDKLESELVKLIKEVEEEKDYIGYEEYLKRRYNEEYEQEQKEIEEKKLARTRNKNCKKA